ncbi:hypothetical protein BS50DRAFT_6150 [Corynespora cassiicola Philippines]|uniref:Uncharacterized protein n=1 Tax=Corynespora cassiicola Philippines TaxID=1448308 RepID=A0A2T2P8R1_CORCC|nr:hypothetical protein BS50DRAFT_6150 [Corynespora cassiicola Philippines]
MVVKSTNVEPAGCRTQSKDWRLSFLYTPDHATFKTREQGTRHHPFTSPNDKPHRLRCQALMSGLVSGPWLMKCGGGSAPFIRDAYADCVGLLFGAFQTSKSPDAGNMKRATAPVVLHSCLSAEAHRHLNPPSSSIRGAAPRSGSILEYERACIRIVVLAPHRIVW